MAECATSSSETDMRCVRCFEEAVFERKWRELFASLVGRTYSLVPPRGDGIFVGWHNVDLFVLPPSDRVSYYVPVPSW